MEAILKLIVGVDGVTAEMLLQISYLYAALKITSTIATLAGAIAVFAMLFYTIRWGINRNCSVVEARIAAKVTEREVRGD